MIGRCGQLSFFTALREKQKARQEEQKQQIKKCVYNYSVFRGKQRWCCVVCLLLTNHHHHASLLIIIIIVYFVHPEHCTVSCSLLIFPHSLFGSLSLSLLKEMKHTTVADEMEIHIRRYGKLQQSPIRFTHRFSSPSSSRKLFNLDSFFFLCSIFDPLL